MKGGRGAAGGTKGGGEPWERGRPLPSSSTGSLSLQAGCTGMYTNTKMPVGPGTPNDEVSNRWQLKKTWNPIIKGNIKIPC